MYLKYKKKKIFTYKIKLLNRKGDFVKVNAVEGIYIDHIMSLMQKNQEGIIDYHKSYQNKKIQVLIRVVMKVSYIIFCIIL